MRRSPPRRGAAAINHCSGVWRGKSSTRCFGSTPTTARPASTQKCAVSTFRRSIGEIRTDSGLAGLRNSNLACVPGVLDTGTVSPGGGFVGAGRTTESPTHWLRGEIKMAVQITDAESVPAVSYNRIHLLRLDVDQPISSSDTAAPVYSVRLVYQKYGVVDGVRYYHSCGAQELNLPDYFSLAMADAQQGDTTLLGALQAIEAAIAAILTDQAGLQASVV